MLIDTHAHLNFKDYDQDLEAVINRAEKDGVSQIICVSSNIEDSKKAVQIAKKHPGVVFAAVGIHPQQTDPENRTELDKQIKQLIELTQAKEVVAIGECGLDDSPAIPGERNRTKKEQLFLFKEQIKLSQKLNLPLLIHSRKAFNDTIEILTGYKNLKGIFHCYSGGKKGIKQVEKLGFFFGIDGNLTYDQGLQNVFKLIPLNKILLETDAPFLAPAPFRGQRSEPSHIKLIAECLAEIKAVSAEKVAQVTTQNAQSLFSLH